MLRFAAKMNVDNRQRQIRNRTKLPAGPIYSKNLDFSGFFAKLSEVEVQGARHGNPDGSWSSLETKRLQ